MLLELIMDIKLKNEEQLLTWIARFYAIAGKELQIKEELHTRVGLSLNSMERAVYGC